MRIIPTHILKVILILLQQGYISFRPTHIIRVIVGHSNNNSHLVQVYISFRPTHIQRVIVGHTKE